MNFVLWGEDKSCKNTLSLTFPKPMVDMEFDIGGFERSCRNLPNLPIKDWHKQGLIKLEQFIMPFQIGQFDAVKDNVRQSKIVIGMKELFYEFAGRFITHLKDPAISTIMVDTGTLLYDITCQAYLQELQEKQLPLLPNGMGRDNKPLRTQLLPIEYREPYIRMRGFAYQAKAFKKHLVVTHHASDEYGPVRQRDGSVMESKTGNRVMHGWTQWGDSADIVGHIYWDKKEMKPYFKVELAEVKELEGMVFVNPNFDDISLIVSLLRDCESEQVKQLIIENQKNGLAPKQIGAMVKMV